MRRRRSSCQGAVPRRRGGACTTTTLLALALIATGLATALGQAVPSPAESQNQCGVIQVTGKRCDFRAVAGNQALLKIKVRSSHCEPAAAPGGAGLTTLKT